MGNDPASVPALPQTGLTVTPTRSIYEFEGANVHVTLTFMTPALPQDLDAISLPLSFLTWQVRSADGKSHAVSLYDSTSSELVVNRTSEKVNWSREKAGKLIALRVGTVEQPVVGSSGDDHRINWGYAYAAAPAAEASAAIGADKTLLDAFVADGKLPAQDDTQMPRAVNDNQPVMAFAFNLGNVSAGAGHAAGDRGLRRNRGDQIFRQKTAAVLETQRRDRDGNAGESLARLSQACGTLRQI